MSPEAAALLMLAVGGGLAFQAPVNAGLARATGGLPAALVSFTVGTALILAVAIVSGEISRLEGIADASWHDLLGGVIGATYVAVTLFTVGSIGAGGVAAGIISGQLIASVVLDAAGALGLEREPLSLERILGVALLALGTYLVIRLRADSPPPAEPPRFGRGVATAAVVLVGGLTAAQAPINAGLAEETGHLDAALVNFAVGTVILTGIVAGAGTLSSVRRAARVPWYYLLGGLFGAVNQVAAIALVRTIGASGITAATITGQLVASVALDRAGAFGLVRRSLNPVRVLGVLMLGVGTYAIVA